MAGLILKLSAGDRFVANGVVIENGDRRASLRILTPNSNVLRLRDAIHPEEVNTPVKRVCYILQLALAGEADLDETRRQAGLGISQLRDVFSGIEFQKKLIRASEDVAEGRFYPALRGLRSLLESEERLLAVAEMQ